MTTTNIYADTGSKVSDGTGVVAGGSTMALGGVAPNDHGLLRFDTSSLNAAHTIVEANLRLTVSAVGANPVAWGVWAATFTTGGIVQGDYNLAESNTAPRVAYIDQIFDNTATAGDDGLVAIPSSYIDKDGNSDFEIRPLTATTLAGESITVHGPTAVSNDDKPALIIVTATDAELRARNEYRTQAIGSESYLAFDVQGTDDAPVKGKVMVDVFNSNIDSYAENLQGRGISDNRVRPRKITYGRSGAGGDFSFDITPEKWVKMLVGFMKRVQTVDSVGTSDLTGSPSVAPYSHYFKVAKAKEVKAFTFVEKQGSFRYVYPTCYLSSLQIGVGMDDIVSGTCTMAAREQYIYDENAAGTDDNRLLSATAGYDSVANSVMSYAGSEVLFDNDGQTGDFVQSFNITLRQDVRERRGLNKERGVAGHFVMGFSADISLSMYFENELQLRAYLGDKSRDFPTKARKDIVFQQVDLKMCGILGSDEQEIVITLPKLVYTAVSHPTGGEGEIMLDCSAVAVFNDSGTTNDTTGGKTSIQIKVKNSEPKTIFDASTDLITVFPAEDGNC